VVGDSDQSLFEGAFQDCSKAGLSVPSSSCAVDSMAGKMSLQEPWMSPDRRAQDCSRSSVDSPLDCSMPRGNERACAGGPAGRVPTSRGEVSHPAGASPSGYSGFGQDRGTPPPNMTIKEKRVIVPAGETINPSLANDRRKIDLLSHPPISLSRKTNLSWSLVW